MKRTLENARVYDARSGSLLDDMIAHGLLYDAARGGDQAAADKLREVEGFMRCEPISRKAVPGDDDWGTPKGDTYAPRGITKLH